MANLDRIITATVKTNGEVIEYHVMTPTEVSTAYKEVEAYLEAYRTIKSGLLNTSMQMMNRSDDDA